VRILLINRFFGGHQTPTGRMLRDVAQELHRQGHELAVLASKSSYAGQPHDFDKDEMKFNLCQVPEFGGGRLLRWTSFWLRAMLSLASRRWDRCVLLTDPPFLPFAAWLTFFCRSPQQRIYWWTMDIYPEALIAAGMIRETGLFNRCLRSLNELGLRRMSGVITLGGRQLKRLQTYRRWNPAANFAAVVPPWDIRPIQRVDAPANRVLNRLSAHGKKVALYTGNLGEGHLFTQFVDAACRLQNQGRRDWLFVFVVRGTGRPELEAMGANLPNLRILDYLPESETPDLLWSATVHLVSMKPGWEGVIVPSKLYGTLQTCAPVLFLGPLDADSATEIQVRRRGISLPPTATGEDVVCALDKLAEPAWIREPEMATTAARCVAGFITR
jgi:colanic acid biosynthesis glycosyl transferase WcaI